MSERFVGDGRLRLSGRFDAARTRPERRLARTTSGGVLRPAGGTATGDQRPSHRRMCDHRKRIAPSPGRRPPHV